MKIIKITFMFLLVAGVMLFASNQAMAAFSDQNTWGEDPGAAGDVWSGELFGYYQVVGVPILPNNLVQPCPEFDSCPIEILVPDTKYKDYVTKIFFLLKLTRRYKGKDQVEVFTGEGKINSSNLFYLLGGTITGHQRDALHSWLTEAVYPFLNKAAYTSGALKSVTDVQTNIFDQDGGTYHPPGTVLFVGAKVEIAVE